MSRWRKAARKAAKVVAIASSGTVACGSGAYRWQNRTVLPPHELQSLQGRSVVLTGGTSGIGRATAEGLLKLGAHVVVGARDAARGQALVEALAREGKIEVLPLDLTDPASVAAFATEAGRRAREETGGIHAVVSSAAEIRCGIERTPGGMDATFATNQLGPQQLLECLTPELARADAAGQQGGGDERRAKVVLLGSRLERRGTVDLESLDRDGVPDPAMFVNFDPMRNYAASKLANMHLAAELRGRLAARPVDVLVVSPGMVNTNLWGHFPLWYRILTFPVRAASLRSPRDAAQGVLFAVAAREAEGAQGYFFDGTPLESSPAAMDAEASSALFRLCGVLTRREAEARASCGAGASTPG